MWPVKLGSLRIEDKTTFPLQIITMQQHSTFLSLFLELHHTISRNSHLYIQEIQGTRI